MFELGNFTEMLLSILIEILNNKKQFLQVMYMSCSSSLLHRNILSKCCFYNDKMETLRKHWMHAEFERERELFIIFKYESFKCNRQRKR